MKRQLLCVSLLLCITALLHAQSIGIGTSTPNSSAILELSSTDKGFLPPRMTTAQRDLIPSPATGLVIYNTTIKSFECFNGTEWYSTVHYIGERYGGGIVFFVYDNGQHGLIASRSDQTPAGVVGVRYHDTGIDSTLARADGIRAGYINTCLIVAAEASQGTLSKSAARYCVEYKVTEGGVTYGDWYLPSKYELNLLHLQRALVGGFSTTNPLYWSSTESSRFQAWWQAFSTASSPSTSTTKGNFGNVRAIRAF